MGIEYKTIALEKVKETIKNLVIEINSFLSPAMLEELENALKKEESETGQEILTQIINNFKYMRISIE